MMDMEKKLEILTEAAKYDVSCSSSGVEQNKRQGTVGSTSKSGICHSFSSDGRCISLLKILLSNACVFDCEYCINRRSNSIPRATFSPEEVAKLTMDFYMRNYIEGLFLSSAIIKDINYTSELLIKVLEILRHDHGFKGYIHVKAIPGAEEQLIDRLALLADRLSVNVELPSKKSLQLLAPQKEPEKLYKPMKQIALRKAEYSLMVKQNATALTYAPAGQTTQMIVGASPESDYEIIKISEKLYKTYQLKRVYYSAYIPVNESQLLPAVTNQPPLLREHRLYQADWLMRFYQFQSDEILSSDKPNFNLYLDPKANWAIQNYAMFPFDIQTSSYKQLLRVPGIGPKSALKITKARKHSFLDFSDLKRLGVVMKRAQYFIACRGKMTEGIIREPEWIISDLISAKQFKQLKRLNTQSSAEQLTLFDSEHFEEKKQKELGIGKCY